MCKRERIEEESDLLNLTHPFMLTTLSFTSEFSSRMIYLGMLGGALLGRLGA